MKRLYYTNYLISDLPSGDYLAHHGVLGMKWGIRRYQSYSTVPRGSGEGGKETGLAKKRARLQAKKASNNAKIKKARADLNSSRSAKDIAKQKKYEAKLRKVESQWITKAAEKAEMRGEHIGTLGEIKLRQKARYERKASKYQVRNDKLNSRIADLEYKNLKIDKKLKNVDTKEKINEINRQRKADLDNLKGAGIERYRNDGDHYWDVDKMINRFYDDEVREAKGKKRKQFDTFGKYYDQELIDIALTDADERQGRPREYTYHYY